MDQRMLLSILLLFLLSSNRASGFVDTPKNQLDCYLPPECDLDRQYYNGDCMCVDCEPLVNEYSCYSALIPRQQLLQECRDALTLGYCQATMRNVSLSPVAGTTTERIQHTSTEMSTTTATLSSTVQHPSNSNVALIFSLLACFFALAILFTVIIIRFCARGRSGVGRQSGLNESVESADELDEEQSPIVEHPGGTDSGCNGPCRTCQPIKCPDESSRYLSKGAQRCSKWLSENCSVQDGVSSEALAPNIPASSMSVCSIVRQLNPLLHLSAPMLAPAATNAYGLKCRDQILSKV
ncbi:hypothetical protein BOX15_Mlig030720g8 [Macrostomum lignano]|uniref:Uncharacterized protein n=2 Tax=Macrostomum lignano TaxID=282301 RepID=A0A267EWF3_9PLAT|nr:hypothetical protein BOX15_Mlig030720g8 [Macrostomum lignano]